MLGEVTMIKTKFSDRYRGFGIDSPGMRSTEHREWVPVQ